MVKFKKRIEPTELNKYFRGKTSQSEAPLGTKTGQEHLSRFKAQQGGQCQGNRMSCGAVVRNKAKKGRPGT